MPLLTKFTSLVSNLSPFRLKATPVSRKDQHSSSADSFNAAAFMTPRSQSGLLTPANTASSDKKRKRQASSLSAETTPTHSGLLTPESLHDDSPSYIQRKKVKVYDNTVIESVEQDHLEQQKLPNSGATKPAAFQPEDITAREWREERDERLAEAQKLRKKRWPEADVALFTKISLRGFEPLLPSHWQWEFEALPDDLFALRKEDPYMKSLEINKNQCCDFRATKALWALIDLGHHVQDHIMLKQEPHRRIARTFRRVLDWALDDADLLGKKGVLPLAVVCAAPSTADAKAIQQDLNEKLHRLAMQWKDAVKEGHAEQMPPLYGIAVSHAVWAIVAFTPDGKSQEPEALERPDNFSTMLFTFNLTKPGQEVWVAFAFAIFAVHCRDELLKVLDAGLVPAYDGSYLPTAPDPDE